MKQNSILVTSRLAGMALLVTLVIASTPALEAQEPATNSAPTITATPGAADSTAPAPAPSTTPAAANTTPSEPSTAGPLAPSANPDQQELHDSYVDFTKGNIDAALANVNSVIQAHPDNKMAYMLRAAIYVQEKQWDKADADYDVILLKDPSDSAVKFNQAELKFAQKKYDDARPGFVELNDDKNLGDFASYKVFLCDLFGGHEDLASKELAAFNDVGGNPSFYFANAAWDLVHNKPQDALSWLKSAKYIYAGAPQKFQSYTSSLVSLGYLPARLSSTP